MDELNPVSKELVSNPAERVISLTDIQSNSCSMITPKCGICFNISCRIVSISRIPAVRGALKNKLFTQIHPAPRKAVITIKILTTRTHRIYFHEISKTIFICPEFYSNASACSRILSNWSTYSTRISIIVSCAHLDSIEMPNIFAAPRKLSL